MDEAAFGTSEERALWDSFLSVKNQINPGIDLLIIKKSAVLSDPFVTVLSRCAPSSNMFCSPTLIVFNYC